MIEILPIPALTDNYIWAITDHKNTVIIDPGDAEPVISFLEERNLTLSGILVTHQHPDQINGIAQLVELQPAIPVWAPANEKIPHATKLLHDGDEVDLAIGGIILKVLDVPGHTKGHIAYIGELPGNQPFLLSGDTLFSAGCGRLFEGTPEQMLSVMRKFRALPDSTWVYCTHEHTLSNLAFAMTVEPANPDIQQRIMDVTVLREQNRPSLPCTIGNEKKVNPFLRWDSLQLKIAVEDWADTQLTDDISIFTAVRKWKDKF
ncbi:MAG: hydroxyacylglutathione hydrolase [Moraxellaceae bacterium]|nr:MAG: hydroxyacylglutathione hydrolase [Moraxellaceae bacterium]